MGVKDFEICKSNKLDFYIGTSSIMFPYILPTSTFLTKISRAVDLERDRTNQRKREGDGHAINFYVRLVGICTYFGVF